jgi:CMP-N-acetylneuraminic acid synthetase
MKTVAMIPHWHEYRFPDQSVSDRDTLKIAGHSLIERTIHLLQNIEQIDQIIIYSSNEKVLEVIDDSLSYSFSKRDHKLDDANVSIEDIIETFLPTTDADVILLMHPKCPFLSPRSIEDCLNKVVSGSFDSSFVGSKYQKMAWFKGEPLNYSLVSNGKTQNLSSLEPVILESSSVYVFTRELFDKSRRRIGKNPYIKFVGHFEGFEIDRAEDFEIAELIINAGLDVLEHSNADS